MGRIALYTWHCLAVKEFLVTAMMGHLGLYLERRWADLPVVVITIIAAAKHLAEASTAAIATVWAASIGGTA